MPARTPSPGRGRPERAAAPAAHLTDAARVLVVDDDPVERARLGSILAPLGAGLRFAGSVTEAIAAIAEREPTLIILDLQLGDGPGDDVLAALRRTSHATVMIHSGIADPARTAALLDAGADDFVVKPVDPAEFLARVRAHLRRHTPIGAGPAHLLRHGAVVIDVAGSQVTRAGRPVPLTDTEWGLIRALARRAGRTVTHATLWKEVWRRQHGDPLGHLRVHVAHLRRKLEDEPAMPQIIVTDPGVGYRLEVE